MNVDWCNEQLKLYVKKKITSSEKKDTGFELNLC